MDVAAQPAADLQRAHAVYLCAYGSTDPAAARSFQVLGVPPLRWAGRLAGSPLHWRREGWWDGCYTAAAGAREGTQTRDER
jgi:hypothetical protein